MLFGIPMWVPFAVGTGFLIAKNKIMENFKKSQDFQNYQQEQNLKMQTLKQQFEKAKIDYDNGEIIYEEFFDAKKAYSDCETHVNSSNFVLDAMKSFDKQSFDNWTEYNGNFEKSYVFGGTVGALMAIPYTFVACHRRIEKWKIDEQAQPKDPQMFDKIK